MEQHERAVAGYLADLAGDAAARGVILVGSVARGEERPDSDVDVYLVVDDDAYAAADAAGRVAWVEREGRDYPGSYIDIKLTSPHYLATAVERADDPTRASFEGARVVWSRMPERELERTVAQIATPPAYVWTDRTRSYLAQARLYGGYFLRQADERADPFLLRHASVHLALAAARLALAESQRLLPGPKYVSALMREVDAPTGFAEAWLAVVETPSRASGDALLAILEQWVGDRQPFDDSLSQFIRDNELAWLHGTIPPEFW